VEVISTHIIFYMPILLLRLPLKQQQQRATTQLLRSYRGNRRTFELAPAISSRAAAMAPRPIIKALNAAATAHASKRIQ